MDNKKDFQDLNDLLSNINNSFPKIEPTALRDIWVFVQEYFKEIEFPEETYYYVDEVYLEGLEILDSNKITETMVEGIAKYSDMKLGTKTIPPAVIVRGNLRLFIVYGETYVLEAYIRKVQLPCIIIDVDYPDPIEVFKIKAENTMFFSARVENILIKLKNKK